MQRVFFYVVLFFKWNNTVYKEEAIKRRTVGYIGSKHIVTILISMQLLMAHLNHINSGVYVDFIYSFIKKIKYFSFIYTVKNCEQWCQFTTSNLMERPRVSGGQEEKLDEVGLWLKGVTSL